MTWERATHVVVSAVLKMAVEAAALLDQLMGVYRDVGPEDKVRQREWSDAEVCKYYLCGFCPSQLFTNTKSDVGPCDKVHDETLKKAYEGSDRKGKMGYETEFLDYLEKLVKDLDRRISRGKERLRKSAEAKEKSLHGPAGATSERMKFLSSEINEMVLKLERLGAMGCVEEAQALMKKIEDMERERERERQLLNSKTLAGFEVDANDFHEKMELCDVCGSFLVIGDTQSRVDAHLLGKQHLGFARIRSAITELRKSREEMVKAREEERMRQRKESGKGRDHQKSRHSRSRSRDRHRSRSRDRQRSRSRERRRSRERHRRSSHRSRSRSRERDRRRDRPRERERDKGRERERGREKDRERERQSEKERSKDGDRDRDKDKDRSRGKERDKEKDRAKERSKDEDRERGREKQREQEKRKQSSSRSPERGEPSREGLSKKEAEDREIV